MELRFEFCVILIVTVQLYQHVLSIPSAQINSERQKYDIRTFQNDSLSRSRRIGLDNVRRRAVGNDPNKKPSIVITDATQDCGDTFCTADPNYPIAFISSLNLERYEHLFVDDYVDNFSVRFDADESGLCQSRKRLIHPKKGQTVQNTWLTIVNDDIKYRQGVLIEECLNANQPCEYSDNFPLGVESKCKQQYVYRSLLAINQDGKPVMEHFQFPSCCKCMVTTNRSYSRFGEGSADNTRKDRLILAS